ncbi:MAG: winged helix-turn-helix domain-containing protein [Rubrobacteraceae bacterium]
MVDVPTHEQLLNPTLKALRKLDGSASIVELLEQVIADLQLPQNVVEQPHTGNRDRTELEYRLAWARTYLKKFGLIINSTRGVWALTPRGHEIETVDPQAVTKFVREQSVRERKGQKDTSEIDERQTEQETGQEEIASWRETLITTLLSMPPGSAHKLL